VLAVAGDGLAQSREPGDSTTSGVASASSPLTLGLSRRLPALHLPAHHRRLPGQRAARRHGRAARHERPSAAEHARAHLPQPADCRAHRLLPALRCDDGPAVQGLSGTESVQRARENFLLLMKRNPQFWLPVQYLQFAFVAPEWQVTYVAVLGLVWNNVILSALASRAPPRATTRPSQLRLPLAVRRCWRPRGSTVWRCRRRAWARPRTQPNARKQSGTSHREPRQRQRAHFVIRLSEPAQNVYSTTL
jgi:hypothetical protein